MAVSSNDQMAHNAIDVAKSLSGLTGERLAEVLDVSPAFVSRLKRGERRLNVDMLSRLAEACGVSMADFTGLMNSEGPLPRTPKTQKPGKVETRQASLFGPAAPNARLLGPVPDYDVKVPVYGSARGGLEGHFVLNGQQLTDVLAPPTLRGIRNAYAVFVAGDSMEPRYFAGEIVFVNPMIPVRKGDFVVAQISMDDDKEELHAFVKQFKGVTSEKYSFIQFNPAEDLSFERAKVKAVHKIVGSSVQ